MKLLIFSLLLCLGASLKGQDAGTGRTNDTCWQKTAGIVNIVPCPANPRLEISQATDGGITYYGHGPMCRPAKSGELVCMAEKPEPVDVPAIQKKDDRIFYCGQGGPRCDHGEHFDKPDGFATMCRDDAASQKLENSCGKTRWTCADPHNYALLTSVDQQVHVCHKVTP